VQRSHGSSSRTSRRCSRRSAGSPRWSRWLRWQRAPHALVHYLREVANDFHTYYNAHQFLVEDAELRDARVTLVKGLRQVCATGCGSWACRRPRRCERDFGQDAATRLQGRQATRPGAAPLGTWMLSAADSRSASPSRSASICTSRTASPPCPKPDAGAPPASAQAPEETPVPGDAGPTYDSTTCCRSRK